VQTDRELAQDVPIPPNDGKSVEELIPPYDGNSFEMPIPPYTEPRLLSELLQDRIRIKHILRSWREPNLAAMTVVIWPAWGFRYSEVPMTWQRYAIDALNLFAVYAIAHERNLRAMGWVSAWTSWWLAASMSYNAARAGNERILEEWK